MMTQESFDPKISIEETHRARFTYVEGMKQNYPGLDPRVGLLGMQDNGYLYVNEAYGNKLVAYKNHSFTIHGWMILYPVLVILLLGKWLHWWA